MSVDGYLECVACMDFNFFFDVIQSLYIRYLWERKQLRIFLIVYSNKWVEWRSYSDRTWKKQKKTLNTCYVPCICNAVRSPAMYHFHDAVDVSKASNNGLYSVVRIILTQTELPKNSIQRHSKAHPKILKLYYYFISFICSVLSFHIERIRCNPLHGPIGLFSSFHCYYARVCCFQNHNSDIVDVYVFFSLTLTRYVINKIFRSEHFVFSSFWAHSVGFALIWCDTNTHGTSEHY